jgi:hypothetical protein
MTSFDMKIAGYRTWTVKGQELRLGYLIITSPLTMTARITNNRSGHPWKKYGQLCLMISTFGLASLLTHFSLFLTGEFSQKFNHLSIKPLFSLDYIHSIFEGLWDLDSIPILIYSVCWNIFNHNIIETPEIFLGINAKEFCPQVRPVKAERVWNSSCRDCH